MDLIKVVREAQNTWLSDNRKEHIQDEVAKILDQQKVKVMRFVMGFKEDTWSHKWEFDRNSDSPLRKHIEDAVAPAAKKFFDSLKSRTFRPTKAMEESTLKAYEVSFKKHLEMCIEEYAQENSKIVFNQLKKELESKDPVDAYKKLLNLVEGK